MAWQTARPVSKRSSRSVRSVGKLISRGIVWVIENS